MFAVVALPVFRVVETGVVAVLVDLGFAGDALIEFEDGSPFLLDLLGATGPDFKVVVGGPADLAGRELLGFGFGGVFILFGLLHGNKNVYKYGKGYKCDNS